MRNVQVISFHEGMVEAGTTRIQPETPQTIQLDQLEPKFMQTYGALIAYANMEGLVEFQGSALTRVHEVYIEKEIGWEFPTRELIKEERDEGEGEQEADQGSEEGSAGGIQEEGGEDGGGADDEGSGDDESPDAPVSPEGGGEEGGEDHEGGGEEDEPAASDSAPSAQEETGSDVGPGGGDEPVTEDKPKKKKRGKGKKR